jgi:2-keto-3-deoxy-L-rhamnonate aldolase RhmA
MTAQGLKELAQTKSPKFGHFIVEFATPGIGHILKSAGCDFVLFDLEHSGFGFETVKSAIRYFEAADLPVIVRARRRNIITLLAPWTWAPRASCFLWSATWTKPVTSSNP